MPKLLKESFSAWIDKTPGGPHKFIVKGNAEVPTGGWKADLTLAVPSGTNPNVAILDASFTKPTGMVTEAITQIELRYDESPPKHEYTNVTIRHDRNEFTIDVGSVE